MSQDVTSATASESATGETPKENNAHAVENTPKDGHEHETSTADTQNQQRTQGSNQRSKYRRRWPWQRRRSSVEHDNRTVHVDHTQDTFHEDFEYNDDLDSSDDSVTQDLDKDDPEDTNLKHRNRFRLRAEGFESKCKVSRKDGRFKLAVNETANSGFVAKFLGSAIRNHLKTRPDTMSGHAANSDHSKAVKPETGSLPIPKLNIVIMIIGSRGDIQPFIKVGKILKEKHGHRVRIATHPTFRKLVEQDGGLELFSIGGDPTELMSFMVKNPGLIPSLETLKKGEVGRKRQQMAEMFEGFWKACVEPADEETLSKGGPEASDPEPFVADAIIANPPSFAHVHCAERLGCPLHMMFTFPYTPTTEFAHPLANIKASNVDWEYVNFMSFSLVELMTWQGLGDLINAFRQNTLKLDPVSTLWAPGQLFRLKVPHSYMWSPGLVPKPPDWGPEIDISGFVFLDLASNFEPPEDLVRFLDAGEPPIYIGFGSIVVDDPDKFTKMIFEAVKQTGVRALINKGWGGIGGNDSDIPDNVFMLDNAPHDWLFPKCACVVHHGGAGTTAIGLKCGKPTMIVPFFGDQPFWGARVAEAKAGAHECIPYKQLNADKFAEGIKQCLTEEAQKNVEKIANSIANEGDGAENAVDAFHAQLPLNVMRCSLLPERAAAWKVRKSRIRLSPLAKEVLIKDNKINTKDVKFWRTYEWNDYQGPGTPLAGGGEALIKSTVQLGRGLQSGPRSMRKDIQSHHMRKENESENADRLSQQNTSEDSSQNIVLAKESSRDDVDTGDDVTEDDQKPSSSQTEALVESRASASQTSSHSPLAKALIQDAAKGIGRPFETLITAPIDLTLAIGTGLHNLPTLYHDPTVRTPLRFHNTKSGFQAARKEFREDVSDAVTGLVELPYKDMKKAKATSTGGVVSKQTTDDIDPTTEIHTEDNSKQVSKHPHLKQAAGFTTGLGKGAAGFVVKQTAALTLPAAYVAKGVQKEVDGKLRGGRNAVSQIEEARNQQGKREASVEHASEAKLGAGGSVDDSENPGRQSVVTKVTNAWEQVQAG